MMTDALPGYWYSRFVFERGLAIIYLGTIPLSEPWTGTLNTEGGFVDR